MIYYFFHYIQLEELELKDIIIYGIDDDTTYPFIALIQSSNRYQIHYKNKSPDRFC